MEIERKFLVSQIPNLSQATGQKIIEQSYISTSPVIRLRKSNDDHILTCKGKGLLAREEFELTITKDEYDQLIKKVEGNPIKKTRYLLPYNQYLIELDVFDDFLKGLVVAEVEFTSIADAERFCPPSWFGTDVTQDGRYQNSQLTYLTGPNDIASMVPRK